MCAFTTSLVVLVPGIQARISSPVSSTLFEEPIFDVSCIIGGVDTTLTTDGFQFNAKVTLTKSLSKSELTFRISKSFLVVQRSKS